VTLHANSIAGTLYNNKFENLETSMKTGTVSVNCSLLPVKQWPKNRKVSKSRRNISSDGASRTDTFSVIVVP